MRLLPILFLKLVSKGLVLCSLDIGDAYYLTVDQKVPTVVNYTDMDGNRIEFALGKVLPGQRDGALLWNETITGSLLKELDISCCEAYPALVRSSCGSCMMLLHVYDIFCLCTQKYRDRVLQPALQSKYKVSIEIMRCPGHELTFLKRRRYMADEASMLIESHPKHIERVLDLL